MTATSAMACLLILTHLARSEAETTTACDSLPIGLYASQTPTPFHAPELGYCTYIYMEMRVYPSKRFGLQILQGYEVQTVSEVLPPVHVVGSLRETHGECGFFMRQSTKNLTIVPDAPSVTPGIADERGAKILVTQTYFAMSGREISYTSSLEKLPLKQSLELTDDVIRSNTPSHPSHALWKFLAVNGICLDVGKLVVRVRTVSLPPASARTSFGYLRRNAGLPMWFYGEESTDVMYDAFDDLAGQLRQVKEVVETRARTL